MAVTSSLGFNFEKKMHTELSEAVCIDTWVVTSAQSARRSCMHVLACVAVFSVWSGRKVI